jgi:hypothetical protein
MSRRVKIGSTKLGLLAACLMVLLFITCGATWASAQQCPNASSTGPDAPSPVRTLNGRLIYHNGIRQWFELRFDKPTCGKSSIQLVMADGNYRPLEIFRGCRVGSTGPIAFSPTGYYSAELFQDVRKVQSVGPCTRQRPLPDYSNARPDKRVRGYTVEMNVDYRPGDHPVIFHVRGASGELHPWQAYASYWLTGGLVLYGRCGHGFVVDRVYGTRAARPSHFTDRGASDDMAMFDPESAAESGKTNLHLGYTCVRQR